MALTKAIKTTILSQLLGQQTGIASECWIGLSTTQPVYDTGENFTEPRYTADPEAGGVDTGYRRCLLGRVSDAGTRLMTIADGKAYNSQMIEFNETVGDYPANVIYFGLFTSGTNYDEKPFLMGALDATGGVAVKTGQIAIFSSSTSYDTGNLKFSVE